MQHAALAQPPLPPPGPMARPPKAMQAPGTPHTCSRCGRRDAQVWGSDQEGKLICNSCFPQQQPRAILPRPPPVSALSVTSAPVQAAPQPMPIQPAPAAAKPVLREAPKGSCPGDGVCNGQGGRACCQGCPAFNNRHGRASGFDDGRASTSAQPAPAEDDGGIACDNCGTRTTPLWRRDGEGRVACNACGLYWKLHNKHRPVKLNKPTIKRRKRVAAPKAKGQSVPSGPSEQDDDSADDYEAKEVTGSGGKRRRITGSSEIIPANHLSTSPKDPMAELADVASRLEPMEVIPTPPLTASLPLPGLPAGTGQPVHHVHPHHHHHHKHHHHHHDHSPAAHSIALPAPPEDLHAYRDRLRADLVTARHNVDALNASIAMGEKLLQDLDAKLAVNGEGGSLDRAAWNSGASVSLARVAAKVKEGVEGPAGSATMA